MSGAGAGGAGAAAANNQGVSEQIRTEIAQLGADLTRDLTKMIQSNTGGTAAGASVHEGADGNAGAGGVRATPAGIIYIFCFSLSLSFIITISFV